MTRVYSSNTVLYARWSEYIAPSPNVKKAPVILLATSPDTVTEGEQVMLSVSETSGFGVDLSGVTYTADPSLPISGTGEAQTIRLDQAGTYTFTAHYSGDNEKYLAADSNRVTVTVTKKRMSAEEQRQEAVPRQEADLQQEADPQQGRILVRRRCSSRRCHRGRRRS